MKQLIPLALLAAALFSAACSSARDSGASASAKGPRLTPVPTPQDPLAATQVEIGLEAYIDGEFLHITVENRKAGTILVGPKNLGLIPKGEKRVIPFPPGLGSFPVSRVAPGKNAQGLIALNKLTAQAQGGRIMFNHPERSPAQTTILPSPPARMIIRND